VLCDVDVLVLACDMYLLFCVTVYFELLFLFFFFFFLIDTFMSFVHVNEHGVGFGRRLIVVEQRTAHSCHIE
jgi:hypothetical protein